MKSVNKVLIIVGSIFGLSGMGMLLGSFASYTSTQNFLNDSVSSTGTVIDFTLEHSDDGSAYYPIVRFQTQKGEEIDFKSNFGSNPPAYQVGEQLSVVYDSEDPYKAQINSFWSLWFVSILLLGMGGIFTSVGFGILFYLFRHQKKISGLLANGKKILTQFTDVQLNTSVSVNNRHPYQIISQWFDPTTKEVYVFRSDNIWFNPEQFIQSEEIQVYVDPQNLKKYYMDISFLPKMAG